MTEPLHITWDRTVIHSTGPGDDTIVCCLDQQRRPVALFLDDELREALALSLLDPNGDMDQADEDEWVRCSASHCPNGERFQHATERGWTHHLMDTWLCPTHADAAAQTS